MEPTPVLEDLVWLFEAEPQWTDAESDLARGRSPGQYWPYAEAVFSLARSQIAITLTLSPGYEQARLRLSVTGQEVLDLQLREVRTVSIERLEGQELLRIDFRPEPVLRSMWVRTKPSISVGWEVGRHS